MATATKKKTAKKKAGKAHVKASARSTSVRDQLLDSMKHEIAIIKHLGSKVSGTMLEYRPSKAQRTMLELLQYLTYCGVNGVYGALDNWKNTAPMMTRHVAAQSLKPAQIAKAMDVQMKGIIALLKNVTDDDLANRKALLPWGTNVKLARALMMVGPECLAAYRMQLFLYCKAAGAMKLNSANCWVGVDAPGSV